MADRRLKGDIDMEEGTELPAEGAEKILEGGFEIGVSRSDEYSKPGRFPRWRESGGKDVVAVTGYILLMHVIGDEMLKRLVQ